MEFAQANRLVNQKKFAEADPIVQKLKAEAPKLGALRFLAAKILYNKKQFGKSYQEARAAVSLNPSHANSYITLGNSALAIGKKREALSSYQKYLKLAPGTPRAKKVEEFIKLLKNEIAMAQKSTIKSPPGTYLREVTVYGVARFTKDRMPLKVFVSSGSAIAGFKPSYKVALKKAFQQWQSKSKSLVSFKFVDSNSACDIECHWTDNISKLVTPLEGGHSRFTDSEFGRVSAEIVILLKRDGRFITASDVERIALHEIGHSIGLNGHSNNKKDIMFMTVDSTPIISKADILTLEALYKLKPTRPKSNNNSMASPKVYSKGGKRKAIVLFEEGSKLLKAEKFDAAVSKFREAVKIDPGFKGATYNLSVALNGQAVASAKAGKLDLALNQLEECIGIMRSFKNSMNSMNSKNKLVVFLKNYKIILKASGKSEKVKLVDKELESLSKELSGS